MMGPDLPDPQQTTVTFQTVIPLFKKNFSYCEARFVASNTGENKIGCPF